MKKSSSGVLVIDTNLLDLPTQPNLAAAILMQAAHLLTSPNLGGVMTSNYKDARAKVFHRFRALNHAPCCIVLNYETPAAKANMTGKRPLQLHSRSPRTDNPAEWKI